MKQEEVTNWLRSFMNSDGVTLRKIVVAFIDILSGLEEGRQIDKYMEGLWNYLFADTAISTSFFPIEVEDNEEGKTIMAYSPLYDMPSFVFGTEEEMVNVCPVREGNEKILTIGEASKARVHTDEPFEYHGSGQWLTLEDGEYSVRVLNNEVNEALNDAIREDDVTDDFDND